MQLELQLATRILGTPARRSRANLPIGGFAVWVVIIFMIYNGSPQENC